MKRYLVQRALGGHGLWVVNDLSGKVVSARPSKWREAIALARLLECDAAHESDGDER